MRVWVVWRGQIGTFYATSEKIVPVLDTAKMIWYIFGIFLVWLIKTVNRGNLIHGVS